MTKGRFVAIPVVLAGLLAASAIGGTMSAQADDTVNRKLADDPSIGPFINANVGPFIVRNLGTDAAWVINTNTGGIRLCKTLSKRATPKLECSAWSDAGLVGGGTTPSFATASIDCGDRIFTLSTGTANGTCNTKLGSDGVPSGGECSDGTNTAAVTCTANTGSCASSGAGSCIASASLRMLGADSDSVTTTPVQ